MDTVKSSLRQLVADHPEKNLTKLAESAGVPYYTLYRFVKQQCSIFDVEQAGKLYEFLTGKPLIPTGGKAA